MPAISTLLDRRYRIDRLIDRGGMADVYAAHDVRLDRDVAVKVLREVEHERRFAVEARTLARLQHPNLVRIFDAGAENGQVYLVLELLSGHTVKTRVSAGPLPPTAVASIGTQAAAALAYVHEQGIVHRDVKPSNLMLDDYGSVRLADFGIARLLAGTALTGSHQTIGTMAYLAPEQLQGHSTGPAADVYSLGLVLAECLTGRRVFDGSPAEAAAARLSRDPDIPATLPGPWPSLLEAMTARDPDVRPNASEVRRVLHGDEGTRPITAAGAPPATATIPISPAAAGSDARTTVASSYRRSRRRGIALLALVGLAVFGLSFGIASWLLGSGTAAHRPPTTTVAVPTTVTPSTAAPSAAPTVPPTTFATPPTVVRGPGNGRGRDKQRDATGKGGRDRRISNAG